MSSDTWTRAFVEHLNFYRIHLTAFTVLPLVFAGIFVASNGEFQINYTDALLTCISAITGTGLAPIDLSSLTVWQQCILVFLELSGSAVTVAWLAVYVRLRYFQHHLDWIVKSEFERTKTRDLVFSESGEMAFSEGGDARGRSMTSSSLRRRAFANVSNEKSPSFRARGADFDADAAAGASSASPERMPPAEFTESPTTLQSPNMPFASSPLKTQFRQPTRRPTRRGTVLTVNPQQKDDAFGGFGDPLAWGVHAFNSRFPNAGQRVKRSMTMSIAPTFLVPGHGDVPPGAKPVSYLTFDVKVAHNSRFVGLSDEDHEELGGVEYRALSALLWMVPLYYFGTLAIAFVVIAPYMSLSRWKDTFKRPNQHKDINPVWYSLFEVVGAWANTGMSLVDQNLVPFQRAYPMLIFLIYVVQAGGTAFPIFLRFMIWIIYRGSPTNSRLKETLHFLLDHPRRCFIYLFPSRQTWFLLTVLLLLNLTDWFFFLVLDIGNPTVEAIPVGSRILLGLVQAVAVRLAGFQSIAISALSPAVKILYLVMMYVSAYPVAMSVRSTNVYEEKSLGVFEEDDDEDKDIEDEQDYPDSDSRVAIWGRYLARHARRQLSFDLWWLGLALFLVCIFERGHINNPDNVTWFNLFALLFEVVSAYATVGLSLGIPTANYSLVGAMRTPSKLIFCIVMLRGRHRGLPVALDRAVLLPKEFLQKASAKARQMKMGRRDTEKLSPIRE
ncbi:TrkH-domain-containing protein [Auriscalpium vulgare]|uniref:TrkH-domain-containing protein n=1 Tax=Auriscalpium vulgare TaxID=40419 RepID=A0ACB8S000_9AGAM|nr:TrkH-domain-containing protein [Auriscalpium vulgare]